MTAGQRLQTLHARLIQQDIRRQMVLHQQRLQTLAVNLQQVIAMTMERRRARWMRASGRLLALSPLAVLERGYALVYDTHGVLVKGPEQLKAEDRLRLRFAHGEAKARVIQADEESAQKL